MTTVAPNIRFREARERVGLPPDEVAIRSGVNHADVWEIEGVDGDLTLCYTSRQIQLLCRAIGIHPVDLFSEGEMGEAITVLDLVPRIEAECRSRGVTLDQLGDIVELDLSVYMKSPEKLVDDTNADGLQRLCRELHVDWRRVLLSL